MVWSPRVTVAAVVERDSRYLVVEEHVDDRLAINQPAGHLEEGEGLVEAVRREVLEETGWRFEPEALVGVYLYRRSHPSRTYLRFCFCGRVTMHDAGRPLDPAIVRASWLTRAELSARESEMRSPLVLRAIDDYLGGARFPLSLLASLADRRSEWP
ncbi:MAG: NUDIX hydrolase [Gammaproteobacteria bacterium]|jgi:8-oxo-dGTP pyrophosphatase MutT (NUDIX family)|nr:NUDIX hydrolase [Gammaproteobacteria bacterium]